MYTKKVQKEGILFARDSIRVFLCYYMNYLWKIVEGCMIIPYQFIQKDMDKSISHYFWLGRDGAQDIVVYFMIVWSL